MRGKFFGISVVLLLSALRPIFGANPDEADPRPTPTPPPHFYRSAELMANTNTGGRTTRGARPSPATPTAVSSSRGTATRRRPGSSTSRPSSSILTARRSVPSSRWTRPRRAEWNTHPTSPREATVTTSSCGPTSIRPSRMPRSRCAASTPRERPWDRPSRSTRTRRDAAAFPRSPPTPPASSSSSGESVGQDGNGVGVFGQQFDAAGARRGRVRRQHVHDGRSGAPENRHERRSLHRRVRRRRGRRRGSGIRHVSGPAPPSFRCFRTQGAVRPGFWTERPTRSWLESASGTSSPGASGQVSSRSRRIPAIFTSSPSSPATPREPGSSRAGRHRPSGYPPNTTPLAGSSVGTGTRLSDVGRSWLNWQTFLLPYVEDCSYPYQQLVCAGQRTEGTNADTWYRRSHHPGAVNVVFGDGVVYASSSRTRTTTWA